MNLKTIKKKYQNEWVLIEYDQLDKEGHIKNGSLIAHSPNKEEIYKILSKTKGKNISIEYTGPVNSDLTVMFLFK